MSRFVRPSKYRHTYTQPARKEHNYENLKVSTSAWDTDLIKANPKFLSINYQASGGGAFAILPLLSPFPQSQSHNPIPTPKLPDLIPLCRGHSAPVLDTAWHPHARAFLASGGEDGKILLWNFDSELSHQSQGQSGESEYTGTFSGWGTDDWTCPPDLTHDASIPKAGSGRKVGHVVFNPVTSGLLASASGDHVVKLWDVDSRSGKGFEEPLVQMKGHRDTIQSLTWNYTGDLIITTSRDKQIRMYDPRAGSDPVRQADGHGGIKGSRVVWLGDRDRAVTTGFSKMSDRQMILWDTTTLTPIATETIDSSSGVIMPHYIEGNSVLLLAGKGDGNIRYYEYADDELFYLSEHKSSDPQRGFTLLPRNAVDVGQNEIARGFKLTTSTVEPIGFIVPRKAESFQADIFPPAPSMEAAFTVEEWLDGKTGPPKLIDMESRASAAYQPRAQSEKKDSPPSTDNGAAPSSPAPASVPASTSTSTPAPAPAPETAVEYPKDAPLLSATEVPETTTRSTAEFDPRNLEINQDDSDDEELTEAKKRAPVDEDGFEDEAGPSVIDLTGDDETETQSKTAVPVAGNKTPAESDKAAAPVAGDKTPITAQNSSDDKTISDLRAKLAEAERQLQSVRLENSTLKSQLTKAKTLAKQLSDL